MAKKSSYRDVNPKALQPPQEVKSPPLDRVQLSRYIRSTDLGVLVKKIRDTLIEEALGKENPKLWLQNQAYAAQESIDAGKGLPTLPDESVTGSPRPAPKCLRANHEVVCWSLQGKRRQYICQTCGREEFSNGTDKIG